MKIEVLGSSAGGGLPQFNCNCDNCKGYREAKTTIKSAYKKRQFGSKYFEDYQLK